MAMRGYVPSFFAALAVAAGLLAGLSFERVYDIQIRKRPADALAAPPTLRPESRPRAPLPLRLVDSGGVGIPLDTWGTDYSHDRRVFRDAILKQAPYVDGAAFQRAERDWRAYVERMREYGNNAISVPLLLEFIDFDRVTSRNTPDHEAVYERGSTYRERHAAVRRAFAPLFEWTAQQGMQVFLEADMLTLSAPLAEHLRRLAPDSTTVGIDTSNPAVWSVYRAGLEELFENVPAITGLVVRFGEGGNLYNTEGWPYRSEMAIRNASGLRAMLRGLLPAFEHSGRTLVLRSWTVGVGSIGRLHIDPRVYDAVLGDIDSPSLVVSTKFTAGDFFSYLPLNPTLASGPHRRLFEIQGKPEFEGFNAFPDFLGREYARALRRLTAANPHIVGTYVLPQFGGPLRAGPRTLYPLRGFWLWTDANVFVASQLALDPDADADGLAKRWARGRFGDERIADAIPGVLDLTRGAVLEGFYIRPFAERQVRVASLELPPLMWIFEWNMVGGWHSLLSMVYRGSRDDVDRAISEGHEATAMVRQARRELQAAIDRAPGRCDETCDEARRSLEYQESLFDALGWWRQAFLSYYRWIETGDRESWRAWRDGRRRFEIAVNAHVVRFGHDDTFPAFDFTSAMQAVATAEHGTWTRLVAGVALISLAAVLMVGSPLARRRLPGAGASAPLGVCRLAWTSAATPWRLAREPVGPGSAACVTVMMLVAIGTVYGTLTGFASGWLVAGSVLVAGAVALASGMTSMGTARGPGRLFLAPLGPLFPIVMFLLAVAAYGSHLGFWYWFWMARPFRATLIALIAATALWTIYIMLAVRAPDGWRARIGGLLAPPGAGLVVLLALLPGWVVPLRVLARPLNVAAATKTMLFALTTYAGVDVHPGRPLFILGALLVVGGYILCLRPLDRRTPASPDRPENGEVHVGTS